jgi:transposase
MDDRHAHCTACRISIVYQARLLAARMIECPPSPPPERAPTPPLSVFGRPCGCIDQLSFVERAAVVTLHALSWTGRAIAHVLHCSEQAVSRWVRRWEQTHSLEDAERSGRPRATTDDQDQDIGVYSDAHPKTLPRTIVHELELPVGKRTVRRRLNEIGLHTCVQRLEHDNAERRLQWAHDYERWTEDDWARVLFSDEVHFYLNYTCREYVQRPLGHACDPKYLGESPPRAEGKVSLWGCISAEGLGHAEIYVDTLNARRYQAILALNLTSSAEEHWPEGGQWWFQQDNWTVHTAGTTRLWFDAHGIDVIDWPAWSPDLNPIEELWNDIKRRVYSNHHPRTTDELERCIRQEWEATDIGWIKHICRSLPHRIQLVIQNEGHKIPY